MCIYTLWNDYHRTMLIHVYMCIHSACVHLCLCVCPHIDILLLWVWRQHLSSIVLASFKCIPLCCSPYSCAQPSGTHTFLLLFSSSLTFSVSLPFSGFSCPGLCCRSSVSLYGILPSYSLPLHHILFHGISWHLYSDAVCIIQSSDLPSKLQAHIFN